MKEINDFGFSFTSEKDEIDTTKIDAFREYHSKVTSFLSKLSSNPDKDTIKWPNRVEEIKTFASVLNGIYEKANKE